MAMADEGLGWLGKLTLEASRAPFNIVFYIFIHAREVNKYVISKLGSVMSQWSLCRSVRKYFPRKVVIMMQEPFSSIFLSAESSSLIPQYGLAMWEVCMCASGHPLEGESVQSGQNQAALSLYTCLGHLAVTES